MKSPRLILAAVAVALLSTAALAVPPSADQVTVPPQAEAHGQKMQRLFDTPEEFMMFRLDIHQATRGMDKPHKHAYRKAQFQKLKGMTTEQRQAYFQDLENRWNALPDARKAKIQQRMAAFEAKRQNGYRRHHGQAYPQSGPDQGSQQGAPGDSGPQDQTPPPPPPPSDSAPH